MPQLDLHLRGGSYNGPLRQRNSRGSSNAPATFPVSTSAAQPAQAQQPQPARYAFVQPLPAAQPERPSPAAWLTQPAPAQPGNATAAVLLGLAILLGLGIRRTRKQ